MLTNEKIEIFKKMLEKQAELNNQIDPGWKKAEYPWYRAIWLECAELVESLPWKWWTKEKEVNWYNLYLEIADIWHFILSWILQVDEEMIVVFVQNVLNILIPKYIVSLPNWKDIVQATEELALNALNKNLVFTVISFQRLSSVSGLSFEELAKIYFGKVVLNTFRQNNGLKDGKYQRIWNGKEDNLVMVQVLSDLDLFPIEQFEKDLYIILENYYRENVCPLRTAISDNFLRKTTV